MDAPFAVLIVLLAILAVAAVAVWWTMRRPELPRSQRVRGTVDTVQGWEPQATRVMTVAEQSLYASLCQALPGYIVLAQVPLARFLKVPTRNSYAEWLRRVGHQCVDFAICDRNSKVFAVVELSSPKTENNERLHKRQLRKTRVLEAAGIAFHQWPEQVRPSVGELRTALLPAETEWPEAVPERSQHGALPAFAEDTARHADALRDAPQSTWFDDLDSAVAPLSPAHPPEAAGSIAPAPRG